MPHPQRFAVATLGELVIDLIPTPRADRGAEAGQRPATSRCRGRASRRPHRHRSLQLPAHYRGEFESPFLGGFLGAGVGPLAQAGLDETLSHLEPAQGLGVAVGSDA
jgi:hypothetical protein